MALPNGSGGYQLGDGNRNEVVMGYSAVPQTATATASLSAAQITGNILVANPSSTAATYTLPTAAQIDAAVPSATVGSTFGLVIVNIGTGSGAVTLSVTGTGITDGGNALTAVAVTSSARFLFRKTGDGAWTVYRV